MDEKVNLHKIVEMPEKEFRKHIYNWLRDKDLSRELQAKLRKNLIENFNNTRLGKIINIQHNRSQKLFKSPLSLILNTLVAEYLYAENCHYSLSVFCAEMPNELVSPNLETRTKFRFTKENLIEILEAFSNGNLNDEMKNIVLDKYMQVNSTEESPLSLLYVIFETVFKNLLKKNEVELNEINLKNQSIKQTYLKHNVSKISKRQRTLSSSNKFKKTFTKNFRFLKKYLILLTDKMKEISIFIYKLQHKNRTLSHNKNEIVPEIKKIHQNLDKISELLSKQNNNKISSLLTATNDMSKKIEICIDHFNNILQSKSNLEQTPPLVEKGFQEWVSEIKNTKSGKEFLSKLESSIQKILIKQKRCMLRKFQKKLEYEKKKLKLKYTQHYLSNERLLEMQNANAEALKRDSAKPEIQFSKKPDGFKDFSKSTHIDTIGSNEYNVGNSKSENEKFEESKQELSRIVEHEKNLLERHLKRAQQEKCIDSIVHEARIKIQELENESLKIDDAFKAHLLSQRDHHDMSKQNIESIWGKYNLEKTILHKKCKILQKNPKISKFKLETLEKDITTIVDTAMDTKIQKQETTFSISNDEDGYDTTNSIVFENPFIESRNKVTAKWSFSQNKNLEINNSLDIDKGNLKSNNLETKNSFSPFTVEPQDNFNVQGYDHNKKNFSKPNQKAKKEETYIKKKEQQVHNEIDSTLSTEVNPNINNLLSVPSQSNSQHSEENLSQDLSKKQSIKNTNKESEYLQNIFQLNSFAKTKENY